MPWPGAVKLSNVPDMEGLAASVVLIAILLGVLLLVAFDLFCLVHLVAADRVRFLPKLAWAVAIVCISPFGGLVYLLSQRQPKAIAGFLLAVQRACLIRCGDTLRLVVDRRAEMAMIACCARCARCSLGGGGVSAARGRAGGAAG